MAQCLSPVTFLLAGNWLGSPMGDPLRSRKLGGGGGKLTSRNGKWKSCFLSQQGTRLDFLPSPLPSAITSAQNDAPVMYSGFDM